MIAYNPDGEIHALNDEWAYILKILDDDSDFTFVVGDKYFVDFSNKIHEYLDKYDTERKFKFGEDCQFICRPKWDIQKACCSAKFKRLPNDGLT